MQQQRASLVVADDHAVLLNALTSLLELEFDIVATANNGHELLEKVQLLEPDVAVTDLRMPILSGLDVLRQLRGCGSRTRFVVYTASPSLSLAGEAFRLGASGYVLKQSASAELVLAIRTALEGRTFISPRIASDVLRTLLSHAASERVEIAS